MKLIGLAGPARVGKDSIADYLVENHGFLKFSFSDALYREVAEAFSVTDEFLRADDTKETPSEKLAIRNSRDVDFIGKMMYILPGEDWSTVPRSPRKILQWWGTAYRRSKDPNYWIKEADKFVESFLAQRAAENHLLKDVAGLVNSSVRFDNERNYIKDRGGEIWHVYRRAVADEFLDSYASEKRLPVLPGERQIFNNGTTEQLRTGASLLLSGVTDFLSLEPETRVPQPQQRGPLVYFPKRSY